MSEGVVCKLRFETTLKDGLLLHIYQIGKEYAVCTFSESSVESIKIFESSSGLRKHMKVKYGIGVNIDD